MKEIAYLSPTSLSLYFKDQEEFYLNYLSDNRPARFPQTQAMSIGSSFDAYAKAYLHAGLFGAGNDPKYGLEALLEAQVEPQHRDWAREHGKYVFEQYRSAGALADLMTELQGAHGSPRFEFEVRGAVNGYRDGIQSKIGEVVFLGKPDVSYVNKSGAHVILDFKVNGYCSRSAPSPCQGYLRLRSAGKTNHGQHKKCQPMMVSGMMINIASHLEMLDVNWANQLSIYGWLCGEPIGSPFVTAIDQIVCDATKGQLPAIRVAEHRVTVSRRHQEELFSKACHVWEVVHSGHIFRHLTLEDSASRCQVLDGVAAALIGNGSELDAWFTAVTRG